MMEEKQIHPNLYPIMEKYGLTGKHGGVSMHPATYERYLSELCKEVQKLAESDPNHPSTQLQNMIFRHNKAIKDGEKIQFIPSPPVDKCPSPDEPYDVENFKRLQEYVKDKTPPP